jgi:hypothetical protein
MPIAAVRDGDALPQTLEELFHALSDDPSHGVRYH